MKDNWNLRLLSVTESHNCSQINVGPFYNTHLLGNSQIPNNKNMENIIKFEDPTKRKHPNYREKSLCVRENRLCVRYNDLCVRNRNLCVRNNNLCVRNNNICVKDNNIRVRDNADWL